MEEAPLVPIFLPGQALHSALLPHRNASSPPSHYPPHARRPLSTHQDSCGSVGMRLPTGAVSFLGGTNVPYSCSTGGRATQEQASPGSLNKLPLWFVQSIFFHIWTKWQNMVCFGLEVAASNLFSRTKERKRSPYVSRDLMQSTHHGLLSDWECPLKQIEYEDILYSFILWHLKFL